MIWWILLFGSVALFLCVEMFLLPRLLLESKYSIGETYDRGIKRYKSADNGVSVVYEPSILVRKYIKQYAIVSDKGNKTFKCKADSSLSYLDFDIVLFDSFGKVFKVMTVQSIVNNGYTEDVILPKETSYVTLMLNKADNKEFPKRSCAKISPSRIVIFGLTTTVFSMLVAYCINLSFSNLFGGLFRESYASNMLTNVAVLTVALIATALGTVILSINLAIKNRKK